MDGERGVRGVLFGGDGFGSCLFTHFLDPDLSSAPVRVSQLLRELRRGVRIADGSTADVLVRQAGLCRGVSGLRCCDHNKFMNWVCTSRSRERVLRLSQTIIAARVYMTLEISSAEVVTEVKHASKRFRATRCLWSHCILIFTGQLLSSYGSLEQRSWAFSQARSFITELLLVAKMSQDSPLPLCV